MPRILYIILFSLYIIPTAMAQDIHQLNEFAGEQFDKGNYQLALKEYQRVLFFDSKHEYNELYSRIASIYYLISDFDNALRYFDLAIRVENNDSVKFELILNKALCNFKLDRFLVALNELFDLPDHSSGYLQKKKNLYLGICYFGLSDYDDSREYFSSLLDSTGTNKVNNLFADFEHYSKKFRPGKVELMSMLLPGLGQIYTGEIFSGLNSFLLLSGVTIYAAITAVNYTLFDGLLVLSSWFYRYYSGGFTNARNFAVQKIENEKTRLYTEIFSLIEKGQNNTLE
jgi:tetratricopeptide (TPR) repeat protein